MTRSYALVDKPSAHPGWSVLREKRRLGWGKELFDDAVTRFHSGAVHRSAGVWYSRDGDNVRVSILGIPNYCHVIFERLNDTEFAYTYEATNRHVETGEESFVVRLADDGEVTAYVTAISKPDWAPVRFLQRLAARRYLAGFSAS